MRNHRNIFYRTSLLVWIAILSLLFCCAREKGKQPQETILAKIADKTISKNEFIRRAEYTVRPAYCRGDLYIHKKIILNSLIAEKLMALEAGEENEFITNPRVQAYLRGRKEQAMRQWQYYQQTHSKIVLDTTKIKQTFRLAGRKYKVSYLNVPDSSLARKIAQDIQHGDKSFEDVLQKDYGLGKIPQREVEWNASEHDAILDALFSQDVKKGQLIGPLQVEPDQFMIIKVRGWIERPAIIESQIQNRRQEVSDRFAQRQAEAIYGDFIKKVMKGKKIDFNPKIFYEIVDLLAPVYLNNKEEKEAMLKKGLWNTDEDLAEYSELRPKLESLYNQVLFQIDDKNWTVKDFVDELAVHPLVFRQKKFPNKEFAEQLRLAIVDMVRDRYLTERAYQSGYDKVNVVERNFEMWKDHLNALFYKTQYLKSIGADSAFATNYLQVIESHLNGLVDSLQHKYSSVIEINTDEFENIKLTHIDMVVTQTNVPFAVTVPSFPIVTTDNRLDYGEKIK